MFFRLGDIHTMQGDDVRSFFFLDGQEEWLIRGPNHPSARQRLDHVEVKRRHTEDGKAVYAKRFLKRPGGADYGYWTRRELAFVSHFTHVRTPHTPRLALLQYQGEDVQRLETLDAGPSLDNWQKLRVSPLGHPEVSRGVFAEVGEVAKLLCACLSALHGLHKLGIVHCDIKADNLCLDYFGDPLAEGGIAFDYAGLNLIDFAFSVWPGSPSWELEESLPINPDAPQADYLSPFFKQALREDRLNFPPMAWSRLNYSVDLYALAVMLRKLLAWRGRPSADPLEAFLVRLAAEWKERYAGGQVDARPPHLDEIQRIRAQRPDWAGGDWARSGLFVPRQALAVQVVPHTVLASPTPVATQIITPALTPVVAPGPGSGKQGPRFPFRRLLILLAATTTVSVLAAGGYVLIEKLRSRPAPDPAPVATEDAVATPAQCPASDLGLQAQGRSAALDSPPTVLAYSRDGTRLAAGTQSGSLALWPATDLASPRIFTLRQRESVKALAFSPDDRMLAFGSGRLVWRWDINAGQMYDSALAGHGDKVIALAFAPGGEVLSSFGSDGSILRWDARTGKAIGQPVRGYAVTAAVYGPNLDAFATGTGDGKVGIWRWHRDADPAHSTNSIGEPVRGHNGLVSALALSRDGSLLVSGGWDKFLRRWNARSGQPIDPLPAKQPQPLTAIAFAPDGRRFASADIDGHIRLWDSRTGCLLAQAEHAQGVAALAFARGGEALASGGDDRTVRQWRVVAEGGAAP